MFGKDNVFDAIISFRFTIIAYYFACCLNKVIHILRESMEGILKNTTYQKEKVNGWCSQIVDSCLKSLAALNKPFKYVVTVVIQQKSGAPLQTGATMFWNTPTDGACTQQIFTEHLDAIVTVFAVAI